MDLVGHTKLLLNMLLNNCDFCCVIHGDDQGDINDLVKIVNNGEYKNYSCLELKI